MSANQEMDQAQAKVAEIKSKASRPILKSESKSRIHMRVVTQVTGGDKLTGVDLIATTSSPFMAVSKGKIQVRDLKLRGWRAAVEAMDKAVRDGTLVRDEDVSREHREATPYFSHVDALSRMDTRLVLDRVPLRGVDSAVRGWAIAVSIELSYSLI